MLELDKAEPTTFAAHLGETFEVIFTDGRLPLTLAEVHPFGVRADASRVSFALCFRGAPTLRLPQQIYQLEHATLGPLEIFLVQSAADASGSTFEAIFN